MGLSNQPYEDPRYQGYAPQPVPAAPQQYGQAPSAPDPSPAYGYANPPQQFQPNPDLEALKAHIDRMSGKLAEVERLSVNAPQQASAQISDVVNHSIGALTAQITDLSQTVAGMAANQPGADDIGGFSKALEDATRAFKEFSANQASSAIDPNAYAKVVEQSHQTLAGEIEQLRQSFAGNNGNPDVYAKTLEASHSDLKSQMQTLQQSVTASFHQTDETIGRLQSDHAGLLSEIETIKTLIKQNAQADTGSASAQNIANIETRLEEITRAIVAISHGGQNVDQLERLEARIADLSRSLSETQSSGNGADSSRELDDIKSQLQAVHDQLHTLSSQSTSAEDQSWTNAIAALNDKLDNMNALSVQNSGEGVDNSQLLARLDALVERVGPANGSEEISRLSNEVSNFGALLANTSGTFGQSAHGVDTSALEGLEQKLAEVVDHLSNEKAPLDLGAIEQKLVSIEEQVASSRDIAIELANQAAMDAVNQAMQHMQAHPPADAEHASVNPILSDLANDIRTLQQTASQGNSDTIQTFDALKDTLEHMVGRLAAIENSIQASAAHAVSAAHASVPDYAPQSPQPQVQPSYQAKDVYSDEPPQSQANEYDQLLSDRPQEPEAPAPRKVSVAQSLVEEANRAEEQRLRKRQAQMVVPEPIFETENSREFNSEQLAADRFEPADEVLPDLPEQTAPEMDMDTFPNSPDQVRSPVTAQNLVDETPLEPGSGGPDLAALVRQANERRKTLAKNGGETSGTDFIAAARRAAQAAAEEANAAQEAPQVEEASQSKGIMSALPDLFGRRKKALAMAAAVALLGAIAIPIAGSLMGPDKPDNVASVVEPAKENVEEIVTAGTALPLEEKPFGAASRVVEVPKVETVGQPLGPVETASLADPKRELQPSSDAESQSFADELEFGNAALKAAVSANDPAALFEVGRRYMEGHGTDKNIEKAALWYGRAADKGFAPAQYIVGNFDEKGVISERNIKSAVKWYKKAARNGNIIAMHNLAVLYATPNGVEENPDMPEAYGWFRQAADHGVRDSQVNLGIFYTKGVGTQVDLVEAYKWFTLAAKAGDKDAENKRGVIADALRPDQLAEAKTRIEIWKPIEMKQAANTVPANSEWMADLASAPIKPTKQLVAKTQTLLSKLGYDAGPADGIMGNKTRDAIAQFQQRVGLSMNGEITAELLRELEAVAI